MSEIVLVPFVDIENQQERDVGRTIKHREGLGKTRRCDPRPARERCGPDHQARGAYPSLVRRWSAVTGKTSRFRRLGYEQFGIKFVNRFGYFGGENGTNLRCVVTTS